MQKPTIYSAKVNAGDGFDAPADLVDIPGWTVFKQLQTEIYLITHDLNLPDPPRDMHVVATSMTPGVQVVVERVEENSFTVSAWGESLVPVQTDFMFVAVCKRGGGKPMAPSKVKIEGGR